MSADEQLPEEIHETEEKMTTVGGEVVGPDESIIGDLKALETMTFGTRWTQSDSSPSGRGHRSQNRRPFTRYSGPRDTSAENTADADNTGSWFRTSTIRTQ